jgi:predicted metal-dependent phosphotriesterase family hydrolase
VNRSQLEANSIVPSTDFYRRAKIPKWTADIEDEKKMEALMLKDVAEGTGNTMIRAGIIKAASEGAPRTDWEKKVFRAAAQVQKATGVPIATHDGANARQQFDLLVELGVTPHRLFLSHVDTMYHCGRTREQVRDVLVSITRTGATWKSTCSPRSFIRSGLTSFILCALCVTQALPIGFSSP